MPLKVSDGIGSWVKDFQKSKAPQFKGKNDEERRDMAIAAYLSAKRGPEKEETVRQEAMSAADKAAHDKAIAAFKAKGGKVKKLKPGYAQGYHGKDDLGTGMHGMLDRGDSKAIGTRKKAASMGALRNSYMEAMDPKMRKVKQLATLGLVGKSDVMKLLTAMKSISDGKEVKPQNRKIIFSAFADLIDLVTGDTAVFQKAKKAVKESVDEAHDPKHVKQAIGIASDSRYAKGNMTGAVKAMNKLSPGIHKHPQVAAVLKRQNESKVNEISKNLAKNYIGKASRDVFHKGRADATQDAIGKLGGKHKDQDYNKGPERKASMRVRGIDRATNRLMKKEAYTTSADRKPENVTGPDGKVRVRMVPVRKKSAESTIGYGKAMVKTQRDQKKALITPKDKSTLGKLASLMAKQPKRKS